MDEHIVRTCEVRLCWRGCTERDAIMAKGKVMDTKKFKSIALPIEAYEIAIELAEKNERSIAPQASPRGDTSSK